MAYISIVQRYVQNYSNLNALSSKKFAQYWNEPFPSVVACKLLYLYQI